MKMASNFAASAFWACWMYHWMSMLAFLGTRGSFHRLCWLGPPTPYRERASLSFRSDMVINFFRWVRGICWSG